MCQLVDVQVGDLHIKVADIKEKYIHNIVDAARKCDYIDKIILFGSSIEDRCSEQSDIDIAVFGNQSKGKCLTSAKYRRFAEQIFDYDHHNQDYDILYFKSDALRKDEVMENILKGETIYAREQ